MAIGGRSTSAKTYLASWLKDLPQSSSLILDCSRGEAFRGLRDCRCRCVGQARAGGCKLGNTTSADNCPAPPKIPAKRDSRNMQAERIAVFSWFGGLGLRAQ